MWVFHSGAAGAGEAGSSWMRRAAEEAEGAGRPAVQQGESRARRAIVQVSASIVGSSVAVAAAAVCSARDRVAKAAARPRARVSVTETQTGTDPCRAVAADSNFTFPDLPQWGGCTRKQAQTVGKEESAGGGNDVSSSDRWHPPPPSSFVHRLPRRDVIGTRAQVRRGGSSRLGRGGLATDGRQRERAG